MARGDGEKSKEIMVATDSKIAFWSSLRSEQRKGLKKNNNVHQVCQMTQHLVTIILPAVGEQKKKSFNINYHHLGSLNSRPLSTASLHPSSKLTELMGKAIIHTGC